MAEIQHHGEDSKGTVEQQHVKDSEIPRHGKDSEGKSKQQPVKSQELTDVHLRWLAGRLGPGWEPLAASLGFDEAQISKFKEDSLDDLEDQIFNMLVEWKQQNPPSLCQIEKLSRQLNEFGRNDLTQWLRGILTHGEASKGRGKQQPAEVSELTDQRLRHLARKVGRLRRWEPLARLFGFDEAQIFNFKEESPHRDQIFNMLVEWTQRNPPSLCQIQTLSKQLNEVGRSDLALMLKVFSTGEAWTRELTEIVMSEQFRLDEVERRIFQLPGSLAVDGSVIGKETSTREPKEIVLTKLVMPRAMQQLASRHGEPVSGGTTNADKGTSSKRNLLQTLLEEFRKMTAGFTGAELLKKTFKLPYIAITYINDRGGSLTLEKYKVHLYIPRGALAKGSPQLVYIFVDPSAPPVNGVNPPFVPLSPMIQCGPTGLKFLESVVLSFPHHANNEWELSTRMCHSDETTPTIWQALDAVRDGAMVLSQDNKVVLLLNHFTRFAAGGIPREASAKLMKTGAFGSLYDPSNARYAVRIHVWNDDPVAEKKVIDMEHDLDAQQLDAFRNLHVFYNQGDVSVNIDNIKTGWELEEKTPKEQKILKTAVWSFQSNSETFDFARKTNDGATASVSNQNDKSAPGCDSFVYQLKAASTDSSWEEQKVRLSVRPKQRSSQGKYSPPTGIPKRHEEESCLICHGVRGFFLNSSSNTGICADCRVQLKGAFTQNTDGGFGGLSEKTVEKLSRFLVNKRNSRSNLKLSRIFKRTSGGQRNWKYLAEELFGRENKLIETLRQGMPNPEKQVLKLYFSFKREDGVPDQDAVRDLCSVFNRLNLKEAVRIVRVELDTQAICSGTAPTGNNRILLPGEEYTTHSQANSLEIADEQFFWQLAKKLGPEWEKLASFLNVTSDEVYRIKKNNVENVEKQIVTMLELWRKRCVINGNDWKCILAEQLEKVELPALAEFVMTYAPSPEVKDSANEEQFNSCKEAQQVC